MIGYFRPNLKQTWAGQMGRGMYEQWYLNMIKGIDPYNYKSTNEYAAYDYAECYYPIEMYTR